MFPAGSACYVVVAGIATYRRDGLKSHVHAISDQNERIRQSGSAHHGGVDPPKATKVALEL